MAVISYPAASAVLTDLFAMPRTAGRRVSEAHGRLQTGSIRRDWAGQAVYLSLYDRPPTTLTLQTSDTGLVPPFLTQSSGGLSAVKPGMIGWIAPFLREAVTLETGQTRTTLPHYAVPGSVRARTMDHAAAGVTVTVGGEANVATSPPSATLAVNANTSGLLLRYRRWMRVMVQDVSASEDDYNAVTGWSLSLVEERIALPTTPPTLTATPAYL